MTDKLPEPSRAPDADVYEVEHTGGQETDRDWSQAQDWKGMDGATAWLLINRHADGWGDTRAMMEAWLAANAEEAVRLEREACELIAISWSDKSYEADMIAAEIRARSEVIDDSASPIN